ncbi:MAG: helical backbone metal receptor [Polyangiaceae bacterium]
MRISDDRHRLLSFPVPPKRVVSLVPSDTLNVAALGCGSALVGRTDYCELPPELVQSLPSVGGTKNPRVADILSLSPDLVIANQEENRKDDLEALAQAGVRVYVSFPKTVPQGLAHLAKLARIFHVHKEAAVIDLFRTAYAEEKERERSFAAKGARPRRVFCPIWMKPLMTIHGSTFISDALARVGLENVFASRSRKYPLAADLGQREPMTAEEVGERDVRYPRVTMDEVVESAPEVVLLPSEPHPFTEADAEVFRALPIPAAKTGDILFVDGKDLCWYGARSIGGLERLARAIEKRDGATAP